MSEVVTELTIDADTAGADQYAQAMDNVAGAAERGMSTIQGVTLAVAGVAAGIVGSFAALRGFVDYVGQQSQSLVDLKDHADIAGVSVREFQEDLFAARSKGLTEKDFVSGLDKIASDLQQATQGATEFSKLFDANGLSIRQANGELKTTQQALGDIMGLVQNASPAVQQQVARIVGLSQSWLPVLRAGSDEFEQQKQKAADLGVIIDDATIAKAQEFNSQWKEAVATWDLQFKASANSILPLLTHMAEIATGIIDKIGSVGNSVSRWLTPDDQKTTSQLNDQINEAYRLRESLEKLGGSSGGDSLKAFQARNLAGSLGLPEDVSVSQVDAYLDKLQKIYDDRSKRLQISPNGTNSTELPYTGQADAVDKAIASLEKHNQRQLADAQAVGLGEAALARFRAAAAETAAVQANGGKETSEQAAKFAQLKDQAAAAAEALARAKINSQISVGGQTAFLSQQDVQIANQLKGLYGDDVTAALNSSYASALKLNDAFRQVSSTVENDLTSGLTDIVSGTKSASQGFTDLSNAVIKAIEQMIIKIAIVEPLMRSLQAAASGLGLVNLGSGGAVSGGLSLTSTGGLYHTGGIVGAEPTSTRYVHPAYFDHAPRFHTGGIAGDEVPIIARRGEGVFTQGQMAALGGGSRAPNVIINNHTDASPQVSVGSDGDVTVTLKKVVDDAVGTSLAAGTGRRVLDKQYGVKPFMGQ
ncbi:phage tail tape measure protein [Bradyrhizobium sp. SZCCHNR2032]|uniref:phage tail tape measure protein n=1 Tax=Bradyrhizobium sp. SZCCHNR2032 TaxID=3057384 RepID=UPI002916FFE0|nr:phage tail tape measure protein [Bradyrhizobium sp. SZCCHNR2032]